MEQPRNGTIFGVCFNDMRHVNTCSVLAQVVKISWGRR